MEIRETPWLTPESVAFLEQLVDSNPNIKIMEFGCGGSTIWLSRRLNFPSARLVTVEHDAEWYAAVKNRISTSVEIRLEERPYARVCNEFPDEYFDLVLIDGRNRILCAAHAMRIVKPGGFIMLDNAEFEEYAPIGASLLKDWAYKRTAAYNCPEAMTNGVWATDIWQKPDTRTMANIADEALITRGESCAHMGDFANAESLARLSIEKNHHVADALNLLALSSYSKNRVSDTVRLLQAGYAMEPTNLNVGKNLALVYANTGHREEAAGVYNDLLAAYPLDTDIRNCLRGIGETRRADEADKIAAQFDALMPTTFSIETSAVCNLKCPECALGSGLKKSAQHFMSLEQFKVIADRIRPFAKDTALHIWGEPMLNPDIFEMIRITSEFSRVGISTNALTLTPETAERLITSGVAELIVSIDGMSQEVYSQYRVGGDVEKAKNALKMLADYNNKHDNRVTILPQFIVFKHNQHETQAFVQFCHSMGLVPSLKAPYLREGSNLQPSDLPGYARSPHRDEASLCNAIAACPAPRRDFTVLVDGSVVLCCYDHDGATCVGNILNQDVMSIWNGEQCRSIRWSVVSGNPPEFCKKSCLMHTLAGGQTQSCTCSAARGRRRQRSNGDTSDPQRAIQTAHDLFRSGRQLEAFDLYEQLTEAYPQHSVQIMADAYDCYTALPDINDRYNLYQARLFDFDIKPTDKVLDVGSGHAPFPMATHLADLELGEGWIGRAGAPFKYIDGKPVYQCNIENLPFADKEFDFVYCSHVLEHVDNPEAACRELMRVAKRGYIETPTRSKDLWLDLTSVSNHRWAIELFNDALVFTEYTRKDVDGLHCNVIGKMHMRPESDREKAISSMLYLKADLFNTMLMWDGSFKCEVRRLVDRSLAPVSQTAADAPSLAPVSQPAAVFESGKEATSEWLQQIAIRINQATGDSKKLIDIAGELAERGHEDTAQQLAHMVIGTDPCFADAHNMLGVIAFSRGISDEALRHFETARRYAPANSDIGKNLIGLYAQMGQYEKAVELCQSLLVTSPDDSELLTIIGDLLQTVSDCALGALDMLNSARPPVEAADDRPSTAPVVRIHSDERFLAPNQSHCAMLAPFWGPLSGDGTEAGRFTRFYETASEFFSMATLENADIAVLPGEWTPGGSDRAREFIDLASKAGKKSIIFFNNDSDEPIDIDNTIIFRTSFSRSTRKPNEFAYPAFCVDFMERYLDGRAPLRRWTAKPTVSFCGCAGTDPTGVRARALKAIEDSQLVTASFVLRDQFWAGASTEEAQQQARDEFVHNMVDSDYVLCTRGAGNFSYRLYETLSCGRIPVFVDTDAVLPFDDIIDWKQYCVWVDQSEIDRIGEKIAEFHNSLSADEYYDMQFNCRKLWEQWLSPGGFFSNIWRCLPKPTPQVTSAPVANAAIDTPYEAEREVCDQIRRTIQPGWTCVDVGANFGLLTGFLAELTGPDGKVFAFEPHPANVDKIRQRVAGATNIAPVTVESMAVSDGTADTLSLYSGRNSSPFEWNIVGHDVDGNSTEAVLSVPAVSLDKYFKPAQKIDFVKIDVEGAFGMVINGMKRLLKKSKPVLVIEFHDETEWAARSVLFDAGYQLQDMTGRVIDPERDTQRVYHVLAMPKVASKKKAGGQAKSEPTKPKPGSPTCLFIDTYYAAFLNAHYTNHPELLQASYEDQKKSLVSRFFGDSDYYSRGLRLAGWNADNVIVNCPPLLQAWARENGVDSGGLDAVVEMVRRTRPDVVYIQDLVGLPVRPLCDAIRPYVKLIAGQIATVTTPNTDITALDLVFTSFPHYVEPFRKLGVKAYYQPLAFDARILDNIKDDGSRYDVTFVGGISGLHIAGNQYLDIMAQNTPLQIWGYGAENLPADSVLRQRHHGEAWGLDMFSLLSQSKITLNRHGEIAENNANNMRLFEATGCGALLITDYKDNLNELFEIGKEIVAYRSPEECVALIKYYMAHPEEAAKIAKAGQQRTLRDHSYEKRMQQTATILERHLRYQHESERLGMPDMSKISWGHTSITESEVTENLLTAWQSEEIPAKQRALVQQELANMYSGEVAGVFQTLADCIRPYMSPGQSVLEIGCSSGYYSEVLEYLLNMPIAYTGLDYSEPLIRMARDFYPNADFVVGDAANLPFEDRKFHVAVSCGVLQHLPNFKEHVKETARVADKLVVAHRTAVCRIRPTQYMKKFAYGVETVELMFNESELLSEFQAQGLQLLGSVENFAIPQRDEYGVTYVFRKL